MTICRWVSSLLIRFVYLSKLNRRFCEILNTEKSVTAAYHSPNNGIDEKTNNNIRRYSRPIYAASIWLSKQPHSFLCASLRLHLGPLQHWSMVSTTTGTVFWKPHCFPCDPKLTPQQIAPHSDWCMEEKHVVQQKFLLSCQSVFGVISLQSLRCN